MAGTTKTRRSSRSHTIGRDRFSRISEVEGIQPNKALEREFTQFDRKRLSAAERRRILRSKFGRRD